MSLSRDLISQFVKITKDKEPKSKETIVYGVVSNVETKYDENGAEYKQLYVKIDGTNEESDPIPVLQTAVDAVYGDRVIVMIKNHSAIITGNMGAPATTVKTTEGIASKANSAYNLATQANTNANNAMNQVTELGVVVAKKVDTEEFTAEIAKIDNLETEIAKINNLETDTILTQTIKANSANIEGKLDAEEASLTYATIEKLDATNVRIDKLEVGEGNFEQIEANTADIEKLETEVGDINTLLYGSATGETLHTNFANAVIALLGDAWIKDAMVESLSAGKILSGDILTNKVRVMSEDGGLIIADKLIQIKEGNTVRIQIGKDASGNYSIIFCDESGNTMFSKNGITENAIKEAIIVNDMVSDTANIHAKKLDINSLFEEINSDGANVIKSTKVAVDEQGQTLDVAFKKMATAESVNSLSKTVSSQGTQITANTNSIKNKVWQQDIKTAVDSIDVGGRNLYIIKNAEEGFLTVGGTTWGAMDQVYQEHTSEYILVKEGEQYVFQVWVTVNESYGNDPNLWIAYDFFDSDKNTISNRPAKRSMNKLPNGQCYDIYYITIPAGATYLRVSARFYADGLVKLEKGNMATEWSPAPEDVNNSITSLSTKYSSLEQTVDGIAATVSEVSTTYVTKDELSDTNEALNTTNNEVTAVKTRMNTAETTITQQSNSIKLCATKTEVESIKIGGRNLYIEKDAVDGYLSSNGDGSITAPSSITKEKTSGLIPVNPGDKIQFQLWVTTPETSYIWYAYQYFIEDGTVLNDVRQSQHLYDTTGGYYHVTYPSITVPDGAVYIRVSARMFEDGKIKVEIGTKATDWTPAPEDMATDDDVTRIQESTDEVSSRVTTAESLIEQLSHSISMLVTDGNGTSLMTQTDTGWMFSTADIQNTVNRISEDLSALTDDVGDVDNTVSILQQAVDDLGVLGEYIQITTYEDEPCIELGELDSDFKLRITNTRMMFTEGSLVLAYFTNQSFHSKKVVVEEELQQGGFVWKVRSNGNLGLVWKGNIGSGGDATEIFSLNDRLEKRLKGVL